MDEKISFSLNGKKTEIMTDPNQTLLWVLRNQLGLTGTKFGCGAGFCGACTVLINKEATRSCMIPVSDV
ncbi:MAG: 2Fe-2S iron-sulfur cluster-binding protein, partial [Bacteroidota bacterium]|nr:2Fe-2S iron-sulfur cluster-binding protein [Bacteroidota bacterium]